MPDNSFYEDFLQDLQDVAKRVCVSHGLEPAQATIVSRVIPKNSSGKLLRDKSCFVRIVEGYIIRTDESVLRVDFGMLLVSRFEKENFP